MVNLDFLPTVEKCFCLLELPIGSLIIGIVELILPAIFVGYHNYGYSCGGRSCMGEWAYYLWIVLYICFLISAIFVIIVFVAPKNKQLLLAAVVIQLIMIIIYAIMGILTFVILIMDDHLKEAIISLVICILVLVLFTYFVCVLHSWYKTL